MRPTIPVTRRFQVSAIHDSTVSIRSIGYAFPAASPSVRELAAAGQLQSEPELLEGFGFGRIHAAVDETPYELAALAAGRALDRAGVDPASVDVLIHGGIDGVTAFASAPDAASAHAAHRTTARFRYPATRLQHELGLDHAQALGIGQLACTTLFGAVRVARALILAEGARRVLCVASDFFPADSGREAIWNCTSDAAVAVLVERGGERRVLRSATHVTKGYYWDPDQLRNEMVAAYFPTAKHVIERTLAAAGWSVGDVDWVMPHNVGERSWRILAALAGLNRARIWTDNIARDGHTLAGDNFINLADAVDAGALRPGERVLLFSFGYGAHWTGIAVEA
jgi:3-oxoacyl-[acyl-carrier-protein] synthase-3